MGALRRIEIDGQTIDFVQHGMKGSIGGVWYEAQIAGGVLGSISTYRVEGRKTALWAGRIGKYDAPLKGFTSRLDLTKALLAEYAKRNPERPSYFRDCAKCEGTGCQSCYAGAK